MNLKNGLIACLAVVLILVVGFYANQSRSLQENKKIASRYITEMFQDGNIDLMVDTCTAPDIIVVFPAHFKMSLLGTNKIEGKEALRRAAKAWNEETEHKLEILGVVAEGNKVAVLANIDRVFQISDKERVFEDHPFMFLFEFKNGRIAKTTMVFDVLAEVEQDKAAKYKF